MRVATYNLESLDLVGEFERRAAALRSHLERIDADILCLQEVNAQAGPAGGPRQLAALDALLAGTGYASFQRAVTSGPGGHGAADVHNLVTLSRWPIAGERDYLHHFVDPPLYRPVTADPVPDRECPIRWDRPILYTAIEHPAAWTLHVINMHLRAPLAAPIEGQKTGPFSWKGVGPWAEGFYIAALKRSGQALEARLVVERLFDADPKARIVVCGDCNAEAREMPLRILCGDPDDVGTPALAERRLVAVEERLAEARRFSLRHGGHRLMLDHILVSPALDADLVGVEIDNRDLDDECVTDRPTSGSFHAPMVAVIETS
jgi:endonuclease/exonuclease/phosphatase family metal-dependent hydrolase